VDHYRRLFVVAEFRALFAAQLAAACGMTMQGLALSVLVYDRTRSPLLAAVAISGVYVPQAIGVMTLSSAADRLPPRLLLAGSDAVRAGSFVLLAAGVLPVWLMLAVVTAPGLLYGAVGGARYLLLTDILPGDGYILGRSALTIAVGGMQIAGYAVGGTVLAEVGPLPAMRIAAVLAAAAFCGDRFGLRARPAQGPGRVSLRASWQGNLALLADRRLGRLLLGQWIPNGLIVGVEALYVPYAGQRAAVLFIASAAGMLAGYYAVGRARSKPRLSLPLYLLLAAPYLVFITRPALPAAAAIAAVACTGYAGTLGLQQLFADAVPAAQRGQAFSLAAAGQLTSQGAAAWAGGALAELVPAGTAMAVLAGLSVLSSLVLILPIHTLEVSHETDPLRTEHPGLRRSGRLRPPRGDAGL
jgi:MFS family permease